MNEKQTGCNEVKVGSKSTKLEAEMENLSEGLLRELKLHEELKKQIFRIENRLEIVLKPREPEPEPKSEKVCEENAEHASVKDAPLITSIRELGKKVAFNIEEIKKISGRLSEIFNRLEI